MALPNLSILFVGDPRVSLELLQYWGQLSPSAAETNVELHAAVIAQKFSAALDSCGWTASWTPNTAQAIELLARQRFDVVISDLELKGRTGIALLRKVREQYPDCVRVIHLNSVDSNLVLQCTGLVHECLPKEYSVETLERIVERAATNRALLPNPAAREQISKMEHLPSLPTLYMELLQQVQSLETSIEKIATTMSQDLGMTANILKIVNSGFFGLPREISDLTEAIGFIGLETVQQLVFAAGIFQQFHSNKVGGISLETLWHHSSRTATVARFIARTEMADRRLTNDAFTGGLLHDVGKLVLASNYPEKYQEVGRRAQANGVEWFAEEREMFGFDHGDVGGYLLGSWNFPTTVVEAVAFHHSPARTGQTEFSALTAVHVADILAQTKRTSYGGIRLPQFDRRHLEAIGRLNALDSWRDELSLRNPDTQAVT